MENRDDREVSAVTYHKIFTPKLAGYYWYVNPLGERRVVNVYYSTIRREWMVYEAGMRLPLSAYTGQFYGPRIPEPE